MISTLEKEITFRFLKARKKDGFLNIISIFSFIGISLGVAVLIIVMSVMNGFRSELINKIVGFNAHITVQPYEKEIVIDDLNKTNLNLISNDLILSNSGEAVIIKKDVSKSIVNIREKPRFCTPRTPRNRFKMASSAAKMTLRRLQDFPKTI